MKHLRDANSNMHALMEYENIARKAMKVNIALSIMISHTKCGYLGIAYSI